MLYVDDYRTVNGKVQVVIGDTDNKNCYTFNSLKDFKMFAKTHKIYGCFGSCCHLYKYPQAISEYKMTLDRYKSVNPSEPFLIEVCDNTTLPFTHVGYSGRRFRTYYGDPYGWVSFGVRGSYSSSNNFSVLTVPRNYYLMDRYMSLYVYQNALYLGARARHLDNSKTILMLANPLTYETCFKLEISA